MDDIRASKLLSRVLRHAPESVGLQLDATGWMGIDELLAALAAHGRILTREQLVRVVAGSDKQRFAIDAETDRIRANQGHSVEVDLQLEPVTPPAVLFHGTPDRNVQAILRDGLRKGQRHHVHLSADTETAAKVGARRGVFTILAIDAARMAADGHLFYRSDNGVWLADAVPATYVSVA